MTNAVTIYHNPRCSKSRQTLALIEENGIKPTVIRYLETPPNESELKELIHALGISARDLLRKGEDEYKTQGLNNTSLNENELIKTMSKHPKLIERPIVTKGKKAVLGRPPENVLALLK